MKTFFYFAFALILLSISFGSCQQENEPSLTYQKDFLSVKSFTNISELSPEEQQTVFEAFKRLHFIQTSDGLYKLKQESGKDINVSENIYKYISGIIEKTNSRITALRSHQTRFGVWDNDSAATSEGDFHTNNDCMIFTIETLLHEMGKENITADEIRRDLTNLGYYNEAYGTYGSCVANALSCYFNVMPIEDIDHFTYGQGNDDKYCAIGRYPIGNNQYDYHAGIVSWSYNGTMTYRDKQWNDTTECYEESNGVFMQGNVLMLYKLTLK